MKGDYVKIVYVDMDDCLADFRGAYLAYQQANPEIPYPQSMPGFFRSLNPIAFAIETVQWLASLEYFDIYILSAPSIKNPLCYTEKRLWVEAHLGFEFVNRLILSPHKHLNKGDYLIDDNLSGKGQDAFAGELIHFGSETFPDWPCVKHYFENLLRIQGAHYEPTC
jgi:5'(3')-deoxyribonucleotidase